MPFDLIQLALDESVRSYDQDGRLHVRVSHLTKACVNAYRGDEIPGWRLLGLDPSRQYNLLRDPAELERAVASFNNIPVLDQHIPVTAWDEKRERVIGSTGTDAAWNNPFIDNSLVFWSDQAIALIETGAQRELSAAYRYKAVMTPGTYQGAQYDGVMTAILGNHMALVEAGRVGSDVVVMDSKPKERPMTTATLSPRAAYLVGSTAAYLIPLMAQDQKVPDLKPIFIGVTAKTWPKRKAEVIAAVQRAVKGKLAQDAEVHIHEHLDGASEQAPGDNDMPDAGGGATVVPLDQPGNGATDDDLAAKVQQLLQGQIDDNDLAIILHALKSVKQPAPDDIANGGGGGAPSNGNGANDEDDVVPKPGISKETPAMDKRPVTKVAMDAAIQKAVDEAVAKTTKRLNERDQAQRFVRSWVGEFAVAMDSAEDIYKATLEQLGEDVTDIHPSAFRVLISKIPKPGEQQQQRAPIAMDKAASTKLLERFPHANRLSH